MNHLEISLTSQKSVTDLEGSVECMFENPGHFDEGDCGNQVGRGALPTPSSSIETSGDSHEHAGAQSSSECAMPHQSKRLDKDDLLEQSFGPNGSARDVLPGVVYIKGLTRNPQAEASAFRGYEPDHSGMVHSGENNCLPSPPESLHDYGIEEPPPPYFRNASSPSVPTLDHQIRSIQYNEMSMVELTLLGRSREDYLQSNIEEYYNYILFTNLRWFKMVIKRHHECVFIGFEARLSDIGAGRLIKSFVLNQFYSWSIGFWIIFFVSISLISPFVGLDQVSYWFIIPFGIYVIASVPLSVINDDRKKRSKMYEKACTAFSRLRPEILVEISRFNQAQEADRLQRINSVYLEDQSRAY
ncbi:hypothetical protein CLU79DRAFT_844342 [Phycomyces nitens]|nr:hypothetical protein CLU79DRAFT_844342 [Phycomyces nitens]